MTYKIKLPQFEGPFDLLLFFIERDELDIYNIPISQITEEFLAYIRQLEALNIDLASEFILFVSTLMRIKARTLLPPRAELFHRAAARAELHQLGETYSEGTEIQTVTMYKLVQTLERVLKRLDERMNKPQHVVVKYNWSQEGQRTWLLTHLEAEQQSSFETLFGQCQSRIHAIFTFLALLELAQQRYLTLEIASTDRNTFGIQWNADRDAQLAEEQLADPDQSGSEVSGNEEAQPIAELN
ncbi:hypothetical protein LUZ63_022195 [Rhynchospora breviuscula]|uniref:Chromosome segregation protein ScpA n=1 Tax=Rhynchospora breviuscula TaxID=2022672 RepID=A0A9P9Z5S9_9POAL|nr:hypothetical protein LUZ63_022195 [Rhynchospora breviuscula]